MGRTVSPEWFARAQRLDRAVSVALLFALLVVGWMIIDRGRSKSALDVVKSAGTYLFYVLATGGIALGYLAWWLSLHSKGILSTPKHPWTLTFDADTVSIRTLRRFTCVPKTSIHAATVIWDDNWDKMKGMEDKCLAIDLRGGLRILIPGSSSGFEEVVECLKSQMAVQTRYVE
jgi:polyferredoxin